MSDYKYLEGKHILIVDDEPDVLDALEEVLSLCHVTKASSFEQGKEYLLDHYFDVAILDIMGVRGFDLLKIATEKKVTAVMLTAHALTPANLAKSYKEGAASYFPKEEMSEIESFLNDILKDREKGKNPWIRWYDRLGSFFEKKFGPDWQNDDKEFWEKFPFY